MPRDARAGKQPEKENQMRTALMAATLVLAAAATTAQASEDEGCTKAPKEQWQTIDQLKAKLSEQGFKVKEIEFEDSCAEAEVENKDGKSAELRLDPVTAAVVKEEEED